MEIKEVTSQFIESLLLARDTNGHKYNFGHALLICGRSGMMGAAALAARGALRSGCGLLTVHIPEAERFILQSACPAALLSLDYSDVFAEIISFAKYDAVGIGCALGDAPETEHAFAFMLEKYKKPIVFDADALNLIAKKTEFQNLIPHNSILTPHAGELQRLIGAWENEDNKVEKVARFANKLNANIVVKGAHTSVFSPQGVVFRSTAGNAGMAKAGSGDVLTGLITGLLARGYSPLNAAIMGVFFHATAGDRAAAQFGQESMSVDDIVAEIRVWSKSKL
ncbi:MAG: NAD(P)H-hydrate dehydratase [Prevotellaceae bacterium]|jgi:NAD(P)H-hydrate epimerase|nr:NAD(P)H-hydrate dehydratase [Prevotellaceae bacterium]